VTERLARAAARHPWRVIGAWMAAIVLSIGVIGTSLGDVLTSDARLTNDPSRIARTRSRRSGSRLTRTTSPR
jgi:uncharacterized membrane protein YdfJ with MMPL/SSD domain